MTVECISEANEIFTFRVQRIKARIGDSHGLSIRVYELSKLLLLSVMNTTPLASEPNAAHWRATTCVSLMKNKRTSTAPS